MKKKKSINCSQFYAGGVNETLKGDQESEMREAKKEISEKERKKAKR